MMVAMTIDAPADPRAARWSDPRTFSVVAPTAWRPPP